MKRVTGISRHGAWVCVFVLTPIVMLRAADCEGVEPAPDATVTAEIVTLGFTRPIDIQAPAGDFDRLFVAEQGGKIRIVDLADDTIGQTFIDTVALSGASSGERGLLGFAFHPSYAENGYFFVNYTRRSDGATVIDRFRVSDDDPDVADRGSRTEVLVVSQPFENHNAGQLAFSPRDGMLYVGLGDGGSGGDPDNRAQSPLTLLGKMLRIDVTSPLGVAGVPPYAVPADNPFLDLGAAVVLPEIWALGVRNPWRYAFDPVSGDLYIGDVGQNDWEEIIFEPAGSGGMNYEWRVRESNHTHSAGTDYGPGERQGAIEEYPHSGNNGYSGCSLTGGVVYRGCVLPQARWSLLLC